MQGDRKDIVLYPFVTGIQKKKLVRGPLKVLKFFLCHAVFGIAKGCGIPAFHFNNMEPVIFCRYEIDLVMWMSPVAILSFTNASVKIFKRELIAESAEITVLPKSVTLKIAV